MAARSTSWVFTTALAAGVAAFLLVVLRSPIRPGGFDAPAGGFGEAAARRALLAGRDGAAIDALQNLTASHPDHVWGWTMLGALERRQSGGSPAARRAFERLLRLTSPPADIRTGDWATMSSRGWALLGTGEGDAAVEAFLLAAQWALDDQTQLERTRLYNHACFMALARRHDDAVLSLTRAVDAGWLDTAWMAVDPDLDPLRDRPDFLALAARAAELEIAARERALAQRRAQREQAERDAAAAEAANPEPANPEPANPPAPTEPPAPPPF